MCGILDNTVFTSEISARDHLKFNQDSEQYDGSIIDINKRNNYTLGNERH